jgi:hypothetical protein
LIRVYVVESGSFAILEAKNISQLLADLEKRKPPRADFSEINDPHSLDGAAVRHNYNHAEETEHHIHPAAASAAKPGQLIKPRNMSAKAQRRRAIKAHNLQKRARALRRQREDG